MKFGFIKYINSEKRHGYVVEINTTKNITPEILRNNDGIYFYYKPEQITFERYEIVRFEERTDDQNRLNAKLQKVKCFGVVTSLHTITLLNPQLGVETVSMETPFELGTILSFTLHFQKILDRVAVITSTLTTETLDKSTYDYLYTLQKQSNKNTATINELALKWHISTTDDYSKLYRVAFLMELNKIDEAYKILKNIRGNDLTKSYSFIKIYCESIDYQIAIEKVFKKWVNDNFQPTYFFSKEEFEAIFKILQSQKFEFNILPKYLKALELIDKEIALQFLGIVLNNHSYNINYYSDLDNWKTLIFYADYLEGLMPYLSDNVLFHLWLENGQFSPKRTQIEHEYFSTKNQEVQQKIEHQLLQFTDFSGFSSKFKFELFKNNQSFSRDKLSLSIADFEKYFWVDYEKQDGFTKDDFLSATIQRLSVSELLNFENHKNIKKYVQEKFKKELVSMLEVFCFDLEIRDNKLTEVCFIDSTLEPDNDDIINDFFEESFHKADLVIGHNIIEFDLKQLEKHGVKSVKNTSIWDTLQVEVMLSPRWKSYALWIKHNAKEDTLLTLDLFFHQVCRLLTVEQSVFEDFAFFLPHNALVWLQGFREKIINNKQRDFLKQLFNRVYCKLSVTSPIALTIVQTLNQAKSENIVLQIPYGLSKVMTEAMSDFPEMLSLFEPNEQQPLLQNILNFEKIEQIKQQHFAFAAVSAALRQNGRSLLFEQLSPYLQRCILSQVALEQITVKPTKLHFQEKLKGIIYGDQYHLMKFKQFIPTDAVFINIFEEIAIWKDKIFIQKMTFDEIKALPNGDTIWTKFSGGQGYAEIDDEMKLSKQLKQKLPKMWIEKVDFDTFYIWGKTDEKITQFIKFQKYFDIQIPKPKIPTSFVTINQRSLKNINQVRLNATTAYRDKYWHFQTKIIQELIAQNDLPIVWFVQPSLSNEIELLQQFLRRKGFFIPNAAASFSRQIELLVQRQNKKKLLIIDFKNLETITAISHFPLRYVIDNLKVEETYFLSSESKYKTRADYENETNEETDENDDTTQTKSQSFRNDIEALLDLTKPYFEYIQFLIQSNNTNNILCCIDNHFDSYKSMVKKWNITSQFLYLWHSEDDFNSELKQLQQYIPTSMDKEIEWNYEEAKAIISEVFINGYPFYDHQIPYLNLILEAKENVLVSLPTGGGKSILFQGPALYRSSLTNKLTIVVTPLKALMEDQVMELQELGFWNSVDFINSDRSLEIDHIYKKIAGGELNMIYVTPERFRSRSFERALKCRLEQNGGFEYIVFDEAHCISQWGNEFRPDYHNGAKKAYKIKQTAIVDFPILLFSATVSDQILEEFREKFQ